ncbi:ArsR family transcriptional regulator [Candidatus Bathyarchaeota archaeon]|nr:ArsR family transcriptional regulator [Candidatus Bathyarchaeota archaeon]
MASPSQADVLSALNHDLHLIITFLLLIYPRASVTELAGLTGVSKSTISRHMKILDELEIVNTREIKGKRGNPLSFTINQDKIEEFNLSRITPSSDENTRLMQYRDLVSKLPVIHAFFERTMILFKPLIEYLENQVDAAVKDHDSMALVDDSFKKFMNFKLNFQYLFFSEEKFLKFKEIYVDFRKKINALVSTCLEKNGRHDEIEGGNAMLYLDMTLPMKEIIDLQLEQMGRTHER